MIYAGPEINSYREFIESFTREELLAIVQMKRLFEWAQGDSAFLECMNTGNFPPEILRRMKKIGIDILPKDIALIWERPGFFNGLAARFGGEDLSGSDSFPEPLHRYPVLGLWFEFMRRYDHNYKRSLAAVMRVEKCPAFDEWRLRRIKAVKSELGYFGCRLDHPMFAFEVSKGCSVGCWFCAYAAEKFEKNLDYEEDKGYFAAVIGACVRLFGRESTGYSLLYSATEPHDNPHYLDFVRDFEALTGSSVCTSTAVTTDRRWIRSLIDYYRGGYQPWPQLSVLSKAALYALHENFTPMEMRDVKMLMQMKESPARKVAAGKLFETGAAGGGDGGGIVPQGSISCISGFIVNLAEGSVRLVSPCYASRKWPKGHRVYDKRFFVKDPADFERTITSMIERNMLSSPPEEGVLSFRDDLAFEPADEGFDLRSPNQVHHYEAGEDVLELAEMIAEGNRTYSDVYSRNPIAALSFVNGLYEEGMIDEVYGKVKD